ncbi:MAG: hydroxypyruvate isomerase family protein [Rhizobiales bacterium]|nr:hydroxypyruvate isomerase family protein [Hyphomicrobiales bacterium]
MPRFAANLSFLFTDLPFLDRFEAAARAGFKGVEFMFPYAVPAGEIRARLDETGLETVLFNLPPGHWDKGERGFAALPGREDEFASAVDLALTYAEALGCPRLHAMAGLAGHGAMRETYVANLRLAAAWAAPQGVDILIEPINTRDMPDYFLTRTADARDVIAEVGAPNLGLQFDLYHRHVMEGGVAEAIREFGPLARHYQCADPADRGEPGTKELDYARIFRVIEETGYTGWIGCEYKPRGDTTAGLTWPAACGVTLG